MGIVIETDLNEIKKQYKGARIAIVGQGKSIFDDSKFGKVDLRWYRYPIWTVNGGWDYHPQSVLGFHMDSMSLLQRDDGEYNQYYKNLFKNARIPILCSEEDPDYPPVIKYPLKEILEYFGICYFSETLPYMIALAIYWGVERIDLFGCDYQGDDRYPGERSCMEFWLRAVQHFGIELDIHEESSLLSMDYRDDCLRDLYGYGENSGIDMEKLKALALKGKERIRKENGVSDKFAEHKIRERTPKILEHLELEGDINFIFNPKNAPTPIVLSGDNNETFTLNSSIANPFFMDKFRFKNAPALMESISYTWDHAPGVGIWYFYITLQQDNNGYCFNLVPKEEAPILDKKYYHHPADTSLQYVGYHECISDKPEFEQYTKVGLTYAKGLINSLIANEAALAGGIKDNLTDRV